MPAGSLLSRVTQIRTRVIARELAVRLPKKERLTPESGTSLLTSGPADVVSGNTSRPSFPGRSE